MSILSRRPAISNGSPRGTGLPLLSSGPADSTVRSLNVLENAKWYIEPNRLIHRFNDLEKQKRLIRMGLLSLFRSCVDFESGRLHVPDVAL